MYTYQTEKLKRELDKLRIHELREVGGMVGVSSPSALNFVPLRDAIIDIVTGRTGVPQRSMRGRPRKESGNEERYRKLFYQCRVNLDEEGAAPVAERHGQASPNPAFDFVYRYAETERLFEDGLRQRAMGFEEEYDFENETGTFEGYLEVYPDGSGFVRGSFSEGAGDAHLSAELIRSHKLRGGDYLKGRTKGRYQSKYPEAAEIETEIGTERADFDKLFPKRAQERLRFGGKSATARFFDRFAPVGKGQLGLIFAPPHAGRTQLFAELLSALQAGDPDVERIAVLIDKRAEEAAEFTRSMGGKTACSSFGERAFGHIRTAELALEHAKRLAESGKDVVLVLDSVTRLARAYNLVAARSGRPLAGGLESAALEAVKKYLSKARNLEGAGSLTILAAVLETESVLDRCVADELAGCEDVRIVLDGSVADAGFFPAFHLAKSGNNRAELLLSEQERKSLNEMRAELPEDACKAAEKFFIA